MARPAHRSAVTATPARADRFVVEHARPDDDAEIRALLRSEPIGGDVRLTLEREPNTAHAAAIEGDRSQVLVARDTADQRIVGVGQRTVRSVWFNGRPARVGYLGMLRRAPQLTGRVRLLARAFALLADHRADDELPFDLTSIVADNAPARRLLERGAPGLPIYEPLAEWITLAIPVPAHPRSTGATPASPDDIPAIADLLAASRRATQLSPVWTESDLRSPTTSRGLAPGNFLLLRSGGGLAGCAAIWDQRPFKQTVIQSYAPATARLRPLINALHPLLRRPRLPAPGNPLAMAFIAHLAAPDPAACVTLIAAALRAARPRGIETLVVGFPASDPALRAVRQTFGGHTYRSVIYAVRSLHDAPVLPMLAGRPVHVEVAVL